MKNEKTRWFGIPKLFPYLKGWFCLTWWRWGLSEARWTR